MSISQSKENIIKKIRKALSTSTPIPFPKSEGNNSLYHLPQNELEMLFAEEFSKLQGKFVFCANETELAEQLQLLIQGRQWTKLFCRETTITSKLQQLGMQLSYTDSLAECDVSITSCEALVARTGSMVICSTSESGRTTSVYAPIHICIAYSKQLVYDIRDALQLIKEKHGDKLPSLISFATGPSRTADIEKTLVVGVHGPKEVYVFLVDE